MDLRRLCMIDHSGRNCNLDFGLDYRLMISAQQNFLARSWWTAQLQGSKCCCWTSKLPKLSAPLAGLVLVAAVEAPAILSFLASVPLQLTIHRVGLGLKAWP